MVVSLLDPEVSARRISSTDYFFLRTRASTGDAPVGAASARPRADDCRRHHDRWRDDAARRADLARGLAPRQGTTSARPSRCTSSTSSGFSTLLAVYHRGYDAVFVIVTMALAAGGGFLDPWPGKIAFAQRLFAAVVVFYSRISNRDSPGDLRRLRRRIGGTPSALPRACSASRSWRCSQSRSSEPRRAAADPHFRREELCSDAGCLAFRSHHRRCGCRAGNMNGNWFSLGEQARWSCPSSFPGRGDIAHAGAAIRLTRAGIGARRARRLAGG